MPLKQRRLHLSGRRDTTSDSDEVRRYADPVTQRNVARARLGRSLALHFEHMVDQDCLKRTEDALEWMLARPAQDLDLLFNYVSERHMTDESWLVMLADLITLAGASDGQDSIEGTTGNAGGSPV